MPLKDTARGYGWISIALHWATAVAIIVLLYLGSSIGALTGDARQQTLNMHTSIAVAAYLLLIVRIVWRFWYGHPGPLKEQRGVFFYIGKWVHLLMLVALTAMLISGPMIAWSMGNEIVVFDWFVIPTPLEQNFDLSSAMHRVHLAGAIVLFVGILLHLGGVYKHAAFNRDGTFSKMLIPTKPTNDPSP